MWVNEGKYGRNEQRFVVTACVRIKTPVEFSAMGDWGESKPPDKSLSWPPASALRGLCVRDAGVLLGRRHDNGSHVGRIA